jgi:WD40 repeat protein
VSYRLELWDVLQRKLIRQIDRPVGPTLRPWVWWDRDAFYLLVEPHPGPGAGPAGRDSDPAVPLACYSWSDGQERHPPAETLVTYQEPITQIDFEASTFEASTRDESEWHAGRALWRGRDGLLLQVGWETERTPLAESDRIPRGTFFPPEPNPHLYPGLRRSYLQPFGRVGFLDRQARLFALPYAALTSGDQRPWPRHTDVYDARSGRRLLTLPDAETLATTDPTGRWLAAYDPTVPGVKVYEAATGRVAHRVKLAGLPGGSYGLAWEGGRLLLRLHPRGDRLLFLHLGVLYLWDAAADRPVRRVDRPVHSEAVTCVAQGPASGLAASGGDDGVILLWDREEGRFLRDLVGHSGAMTALAFRPDGARLASASRDGHVILWDVGGVACWTYHVGHEPRVDQLLVFDPRSNGTLSYHTSHRDGETATSLAFDSSGATLFVGTSTGRLHRLDAGTGRAIAIKDVDTTALRLAFSPGGTRLAIASAGGKVRLWDPRRDGAERTWDAGRTTDCLAFLGEDTVATGGLGIDLWDVATGRRLMSQDIHAGPALAMGADGRASALLVATGIGEIRIFDVAAMDRHLGELGLGFLTSSGSRTGR